MNFKKDNNSNNKAPETIQVIIPATSLWDVLRRYKKLVWPVAVTIRNHGRGDTVIYLRNKEELEEFRSHTEGLQIAYFRKVRNEMMVDLAKNARVTVKYKFFRKSRNGELLSLREVTRYFLYRTGDLKEPEENADKNKTKPHG